MARQATHYRRHLASLFGYTPGKQILLLDFFQIHRRVTGVCHATVAEQVPPVSQSEGSTRLLLDKQYPTSVFSVPRSVMRS